MKDMSFGDLITFFSRAIPAFLIMLALWSLAIGAVTLFIGSIVVYQS